MTVFPPLPALEEGKDIFSAKDLSKIDLNKVPRHVAIMMDGNRRWARTHRLLPMKGHWEGAEVLTNVVRAAVQIGIKTVTVFAFSTENWNRSQKEIEYLMNLFELFLAQKRELMMKEGICLNAIGDLSRMPPKVYEKFIETRQATSHCDRINLVLALNYGGRDEIRRAIIRILERHDKKKISPEELTEPFIAQYLDTHPWGDPDLLIRTSGELRVSNFLLWQISYCEFYVTDVLWPAFTPFELLKAVHAFQTRQRRLGGG